MEDQKNINLKPYFMDKGAVPREMYYVAMMRSYNS